MVQFHPEVVTIVDQGLDVHCETKASVPSIPPQLTLRPPEKTNCLFSIRQYEKTGCVALDGRVGESLNLVWQCDNPGYQFLVHDCFVYTDKEKSIPIIDGYGCQVDPYLLETPIYDKSTFGMAWREISIFKFPKSTSLIFRCSISLCDPEGVSSCKNMIPPVCYDYIPSQLRSKRQTYLNNDVTLSAHTKPGFLATFELETRRLSVLEGENLLPEPTIRYCSNII